MATIGDFNRSSLLLEQYRREMDIITLALQEESQDEREERLNLVACAWPLTVSCFQAQMEISDAQVYAPMTVVHQ